MKKSFYFLVCVTSFVFELSSVLAFPSLFRSGASTFDRSGGKSCAQFGGQWNGECILQDVPKSDSKKNNSSLLIATIEQQGCSEVTINGETYPLEGTQTLHSSYKERIEGVDIVAVETRTVQSHWGEDRKSIFVESTQASQTLYGPKVSLIKQTKTQMQLLDTQSLKITYSTGQGTFVCNLKSPKL